VNTCGQGSAFYMENSERALFKELEYVGDVQYLEVTFFDEIQIFAVFTFILI
jgi:hypothetical protein